jgi:hypothetical protein
MFVKKSFHLYNSSSYNDFLLKKIFVKFIYTKFLIYKIIKISKKKKIIFIENYLQEFSIKLKKKFRRLGFFFKLTCGNFLKGDLFVYKHSKLKFYSFISLRLKIYLKKNIYIALKKFKYIFTKSNTIFVYKSVRGGFLGFSNGISGYLSKQLLLKSTLRLLRYKKYFLFYNIICVPYSIASIKSFFFFSCGMIKNFNNHKNKTRSLIFKKFKFIFTSNSIYYKRILLYISFIMANLNYFTLFKAYFNTMFLKLYKLLSI